MLVWLKFDSPVKVRSSANRGELGNLIIELDFSSGSTDSILCSVCMRVSAAVAFVLD